MAITRRLDPCCNTPASSSRREAAAAREEAARGPSRACGLMLGCREEHGEAQEGAGIGERITFGQRVKAMARRLKAGGFTSQTPNYVTEIAPSTVPRVDLLRDKKQNKFKAGPRNLISAVEKDRPYVGCANIASNAFYKPTHHTWNPVCTRSEKVAKAVARCVASRYGLTRISLPTARSAERSWNSEAGEDAMYSVSGTGLDKA